MKRCHNCGAVILSHREEAVLSYVEKETEVSSDDVRKSFGISITNANNTLRRLWEFGYLDRENCNVVTGGNYFLYRTKGFK